MKQFWIGESLRQHGYKYSAPLFYLPADYIIPQMTDKNGTITFIQFEGKYYGVTCDHVIKNLKLNLAGSNQAKSHYTIPVDNFVYLEDNFTRAPGMLGVNRKPPDIVFQEIDPSILEALGCESIELRKSFAPDHSKIDSGVAIGYPLKERKKKSSGLIEFGCAQIIAENITQRGDQFTLFSELEESAKEIDYSGMSGCPVFWSKKGSDTDFEIMGIVYETAFQAPNKTMKKQSKYPIIHLGVELFTYGIFEQWTESFR